MKLILILFSLLFGSLGAMENDDKGNEEDPKHDRVVFIAIDGQQVMLTRAQAHRFPVLQKLIEDIGIEDPITLTYPCATAETLNRLCTIMDTLPSQFFAYNPETTSKKRAILQNKILLCENEKELLEKRLKDLTEKKELMEKESTHERRAPLIQQLQEIEREQIQYMYDIKTKESDIKNKENIVDSLEQERDRKAVQKKVAQLKREIFELKNKIKEKAEENKLTKSALEAIPTTGDYDKELIRFNNMIREVEKKVNTAQKSIQDNQEQLNKWKKTIDTHINNIQIMMATKAKEKINQQNSTNFLADLQLICISLNLI